LSHTDLNVDLARITADMMRLKNENARLRQINTQMLSALKCALPVLRDGMLPNSVDFDVISAAVVTIQNAVAEAERDHPWTG
jgi:hypothetical protein